MRGRAAIPYNAQSALITYQASFVGLDNKKGTFGRQKFLFCWWNRRELNPCPKASWYNLLRGQSCLLKFPSVRADRQALLRVALWCVTDARANSRFTCTTDLTHGGGRSPPSRYGRHYCRVTAYAARATLLLSFNFKVGQFYGIILPATLIIPQNPCRNHCGPKSYECVQSTHIYYTRFFQKSQPPRKSFPLEHDCHKL